MVPIDFIKVNYHLHVMSLIFFYQKIFFGSKPFPYIAKIKLYTMTPLYHKNTSVINEISFYRKNPVITGEILL